jgi:hypothetical protein
VNQILGTNDLKRITATELARRLNEVPDRLMVEGGEIAIERDRCQVARLISGSGCLSTLEAMADIYRTLPEDAALGWEADSRRILRVIACERDT